MANADSAVQPVGSEFTTRAHRATVDVEAKRAVLEAAIEHRDAIVLEGYDRGHAVRELARMFKLSPSRVLQVVARRG